MNTETKLPDGLQLAVDLLDADGEHYYAKCVRDEHAQRLMLQHHAANLARRVADLERIVSAPRGTDAQILKERELTCSAASGAIAFGYQGSEAPPDDSAWLRPFYAVGKKLAALEAAR
jgi:hypothetical protein